MPMESADFEEVLQEALTERDMQLQEKELPEINIGEALPVKDGLDFSLEYVDFGVSEVVGSVKDGIIGNKTNSLKTIEGERSAKKGSFRNRYLVSRCKSANRTHEGLAGKRSFSTGCHIPRPARVIDFSTELVNRPDLNYRCSVIVGFISHLARWQTYGDVMGFHRLKVLQIFRG
jgi:hypothetical protein